MAVAATQGRVESAASVAARTLVAVAAVPRPLGDKLEGVKRIDLGEQPPGRDTFVGYHRDLKRLARLRALLDLVVTRLAN
jgi:hypothetical protein